MEVTDGGLPCNRGGVLDSQASSCRNRDATGGEFEQPAEIRGSSDDVPLSAGCQNSAAAGRGDVLECILERWSQVEGSVEGDLERRS